MIFDLLEAFGHGAGKIVFIINNDSTIKATSLLFTLKVNLAS